MSVFSPKQESKTDATMILLGRLTGAYVGELRNVSNLVSSAGITPKRGDYILLWYQDDLTTSLNSIVRLESNGRWVGYVPGNTTKQSQVYPWVGLLSRSVPVYYLRFK